MTKYLAILLLFAAAFIPSQAHATAYYVDFSLTTAGGVGTATTTAFANLNQFANVARAAGDIAFVRRGTASTTNVTAVTFTTDGTLNAPIVISADYDNLWSDFATSTQTYTPVFGSKTMTASANITGIAANDWIYVENDCQDRYGGKASVPASPTMNPCEYAYEVASVSGTTLTLFLPYKGKQSGAGDSLRVMPDAPVMGAATEANQIFNSSADDYWIIKGIDARSTNAGSPINVANDKSFILFDVISQGNGASDSAANGPTYAYLFKKMRVFNVVNAFSTPSGLNMEDSLINCNSVASSRAIGLVPSGSLIFSIKDTEIINCTNTYGLSGNQPGAVFNFRNVKRSNAQTITGLSVASLSFEDDFGTVGLNSQSSYQVSSDTISTTTMSTTTNLRAGGGPSNLVVFPPIGTGNTGVSTNYFPYSYLKLFEYPIYSDAASHTYTMYFAATSTAAWTVNPLTATAAGSTTPELYIECEYYNGSSGADRVLVRSNTASDVDFDGSTSFQDISVTCAPAQAGVLYLRGWYGKPRESASNMFYMDTTPVIN